MTDAGLTGLRNAVAWLDDFSPRLGTPVAPPRPWLHRPDELTPGGRLTVTPEGRVFGYFTCWNVAVLTEDGSHLVTPRSPSRYQLFMRGEVTCDDGETIPVGVITVKGHAGADDPDNVVAVCHVEDDRHGAWLTGSLVPEATTATRGDAAPVRPVWRVAANERRLVRLQRCRPRPGSRTARRSSSPGCRPRCCYRPTAVSRRGFDECRSTTCAYANANSAPSCAT